MTNGWCLVFGESRLEGNFGRLAESRVELGQTRVRLEFSRIRTQQFSCTTFYTMFGRVNDLYQGFLLVFLAH
jgi:hypothetical protein